MKRYDVPLAAGTGEVADREAVTGYVAFRRDWLLEHKLHPQNLSLVEVTGDSMEPTLSNGDSVLVDHSRRDLYNSIMYALNVDGSLIVKRVRRVRGGWAAESDNPFTSRSTSRSLMRSSDEWSGGPTRSGGDEGR